MASYLPNMLFFHSVLRYVVLMLAFTVALESLVGLLGKKEFKKINKQIALFLLICCDVQLLLGLALYSIKGWGHVLVSNLDMKNIYSRFWAVEHSAGMITAIILVHVGYSVAKKNMDADRKFKKLFWCSFTALAIFVAMTPWEGKQVISRPNIPSMHL